MAATLVQTSGKIRTSGSGDVTITMPSNFTAGNTAIASACRYEGAITSLTLNSATATVATQSNSGISGVWIRYVASLTGGSNGGTLDTPGTSDYNTFSVEEWSGLDTAALVDSTATPATGNSSAPSVTVNPSATGNLIYGCWNSETGSSNLGISQPGSYTGAWTENDSNTYQGGSGAYRTAAATGSQAATWSTGLAVNWRAVGAVFKAATGGSASTIGPASGTSTAATLTGQSAAVSTAAAASGVSSAASLSGRATTVATPSAAVGASSAGSLVGQAVTIAAISSASGASTASSLAASSSAVAAAQSASGVASVSDLTGSASAVASISSAAGASSASQMTGQTLAAGDAAISPASGVSSTEVLVGSSVSVASMSPAAGVSTTGTLAPRSDVLSADAASSPYRRYYYGPEEEEEEKKPAPAPKPVVDAPTVEEIAQAAPTTPPALPAVVQSIAEIGQKTAEQERLNHEQQRAERIRKRRIEEEILLLL